MQDNNFNSPSLMSQPSLDPLFAMDLTVFSNTDKQEVFEYLTKATFESPIL